MSEQKDQQSGAAIGPKDFRDHMGDREIELIALKKMVEAMKIEIDRLAAELAKKNKS